MAAAGESNKASGRNLLPAAPTRPLAWLRNRFRSSEAWFILLAVGVGLGAGVLAVVQGRIAYGLQAWLFNLAPEVRLSASDALTPWRALWLPVGGLLVGLTGFLLGRLRKPPILVDVVEANALYGGQVSFRGSLFVCLQTLLSNGFGASVGLEAAYAQAGGGLASALGQKLRLRRHDLRALVGAGAGAAIGAAFGAPLTGAFYAFEVVIGAYAPSLIAPVAAAALAASLSAKMLGGITYSIQVQIVQSPDLAGYILYALLGAVCGVGAILLMQLSARGDQLARRAPIPTWLKPVVGGVLLATIALNSPQTLSSGHGALQLDLGGNLPLKLLVLVLVLKTLASIVSLSTGFRGGVFFAALFLGSLVGQIYARLLAMTDLPFVLQPENAALVGMGAMAASVVGGPLTMSFLVLETTHDFGVTAATLAAALVASSLVRERFGYSFSTWRLHLRGETIRSARDVGWMRSLTAQRMMRSDVRLIADGVSIAQFRERFPLGSGGRVVLVNSEGGYAGIVPTAKAFGDDLDDAAPISSLAQQKEMVLTPAMNIVQVMQVFDRAEADELAVVDDTRAVVGLLSQLYVSRRYARELEQVQQGLFGEG
ncbi:MAG: hypothetical protein JWM33_3419 [Caulobacteraceae bacterium]|nr:hypothetical protein [Caulobacteraceae bacterium]